MKLHSPLVFVLTAVIGGAVVFGQPSASTLSAATAPVSTAGSGVYNLRVVTDASPDMSDLKSMVGSITSRWASPEEKVWALFYWSHVLKRQTPPMTLHGFDVTDPIRNLGDYGYTMCSTTSGINQSFFEVLGLRHQYWDICNHTVSAVEYNGKFHVVDTSMSNLVTLDDGVTLASVTEAAADSARLAREHSLYSTSLNGFLTGSDGMRSLDTYSGVFCSNGLKLRDYYYNWNSGHRYVLNLKDDESYTRSYAPLGTTSDYWVGSEKIAFADPTKTYEIDPANKFGLRGNGQWSFAPPLAADAWTRAVYSSMNITAADGGLRPGVAGQTAEVVYKVQAANVITSQKIEAQFARTDSAAAAAISLSINHGRTWRQIGTVGATIGGVVPIVVNLRDEVTGAYETLVRIQMTAPAAAPDSVKLTGLAINTLTQVNAKALPKLNVGKNQVYIGAGDQSDTMVLWPDLRADFWKKDVYDSSNIASQAPDVPTKYTAVAYPAVLTQDAYLTYRFDAPADITQFTYGGRLHNYSAGSYIDFLHSFDNGATWQRSYRLSDTAKPWDVIHYETITDVPAGVRTVLIKYLFHNTSTTAFRATGLYAARMEVNHQPLTATTKPVDVIFRWKEVRPDRTLVDRSHRQKVTAFPTTYVINVGGSDHPVMASMKVSLENPADPTPYGYSDGTDVGGQKWTPMKRTDGTNVAKGKAYTISRPPSGFQSSPDASNTTILTDGVVGSPLTGSTSYMWGQCWASGTDVDLQVDLGASKTVGAFRAHLFGYPFWDALQGQVQDRVEVLTSVDGATFVSQGQLTTSLWKKDVPINHMLQDDERATGWNFERTIAQPVAARYVRYHVTPKRSLCVSELQVLDRVTYEPFDLRIALPGSAAQPNVPPTVTLLTAVAASSLVAPASISVAADARDSDGTVQRVDFFAGSTPLGSATASPFSIAWTSVPAGTYVLTARATDNLGASTTSQPVSLTVAPAPQQNQPPRVAIVMPIGGASFTAPAQITVAADAIDPDNGVARVEFFAGSTSIGIATGSPFQLTWSNVPAGEYSLTAVATDASGAKASSNAVAVTVSAGGPSIDEIVLHAAAQPETISGWAETSDATAASGARLQNPDARAAKIATPLAAPAQAFELSFSAEAGKPYRLWLRGRALGDDYNNDSAYVQFDGSVDASGTPIWRTGTTSAAVVILEDCSGCGVQGWGWTDNGYGKDVLGPLVYFAQTGPQRIRVQAREDGLGIDQIVLSAVKYKVTAPGAIKNDATILAATQPAAVNAAPAVTLTSPAPGAVGTAPAAITLTAQASDPDGTVVTVDFYDGSTRIARTTTSPFTTVWYSVPAGSYTLTARATDNSGATTTSDPVAITIQTAAPGAVGVNEIVLYPGVEAQAGSGWSPVADSSAAGGRRLQNPNTNLVKLAAPLASPTQLFELSFNADAGKPYRLWLRGKALDDSYNNDSVYVQFDGSVDALGTPLWRTNTTAATSVILEPCSACGVQQWGWAGNAYGLNAVGPLVYFATSGPQRMRVQIREDGLGIDQIVLSAEKYFTLAPGAVKNDTTILPR